MAVGTAAAVVAGASLVGAMMQSNAAQSAAETQAGAARDASAAQLAMYNQTRADQEPWRQAGVMALNQMQSPQFQQTFNMSNFQADPGYAFRMQEGQKAIARAASARGLFSTGTLKSLTDFNQNSASQEYQNAYNRFNNDQTTRFNRLASLAGVGQTANATNAQVGQNTANQIGQNIQAAGNAAAAGQVGTANAYAGALGTGANTWMQYQMMNRLASSPSTTTSLVIPTVGAGGGGGYLGSGGYKWD